jgi:hypothetical protein
MEITIEEMNKNEAYFLKNVQDDTYRKIGFWSNSELTKAYELLFGKEKSYITDEQREKAFKFGTNLHKHVLERDNLEGVGLEEKDTIVELGASLRANKQCSWLLRFANKEVVVLKSGFNSLDVKGKVDLLYKQGIIADIKTTSCTNIRQFAESIEKYDYDRQAAWYIDIAGAKNFWLIGVSKSNGEVFFIDSSKAKGMISNGRKKYLGIVRSIVSEGITVAQVKGNSSSVVLG